MTGYSCDLVVVCGVVQQSLLTCIENAPDACVYSVVPGTARCRYSVMFPCLLETSSSATQEPTPNDAAASTTADGQAAAAAVHRQDQPIAAAGMSLHHCCLVGTFEAVRQAFDDMQ